MLVFAKVTVPVEAGNKAIQEGTLGRVIGRFIEQSGAQTAVFGVDGGCRAGFFLFDLHDAAEIPALLEPLFIELHAAVEWQPVMTPQELQTGLARAAGAK